MTSRFCRPSPAEFAILFERAELEKTALLSTLLPIWQFPHFFAISRDADQDYTKDAHLFPFVSRKSDQKSQDAERSRSAQAVERSDALSLPKYRSATPISLELHSLWWLDSWQEPQFSPISLTGETTPKTYYAPAFDQYGWFTDAQWALLMPLLPPEEPLKKTRGRPKASAHAILSAIFWLRANGLPWNALLPQGPFPPKRTCRRYYKRWFLSGRLMTIYKTFLDDFLLRSRAHPFDFVQQGYFKITDDHLIFALPGKCPDAWQTRAALFFMQETYALIRRIRREEKDPYFPQPPLVDILFDQYMQRRLNPVSHRIADERLKPHPA